MNAIKLIATICVAIALALDTMSYWKQIAKTIRMKRSSQVSSSAFLYKIVKALFSMAGLMVYLNWVGVIMEIFMLIVYVACLIVIAKYKPKDWRLFDFRLKDIIDLSDIKDWFHKNESSK